MRFACIAATCNMAWMKHTPELRRFYRFTQAQDMVTEEAAVFDDIPIQHFLCVTDKLGCDDKCDCLSIAATAKPSRLMCRERGLTVRPLVVIGNSGPPTVRNYIAQGVTCIGISRRLDS